MKVILGCLFFVLLTSCKKEVDPVMDRSKDINLSSKFSLSTNFEDNFLDNSDLPSVAELVTAVFGLKNNHLEKLDELFLDGTGNYGYSYYRFGQNEHSYLVVGVHSKDGQNTGFYDQFSVSVEIVEGKNNEVFKWSESKKRYQRQVIPRSGQ